MGCYMVYTCDMCRKQLKEHDIRINAAPTLKRGDTNIMSAFNRDFCSIECLNEHIDKMYEEHERVVQGVKSDDNG